MCKNLIVSGSRSGWELLWTGLLWRCLKQDSRDFQVFHSLYPFTYYVYTRAKYLLTFAIKPFTVADKGKFTTGANRDTVSADNLLNILLFVTLDIKSASTILFSEMENLTHLFFYFFFFLKFLFYSLLNFCGLSSSVHKRTHESPIIQRRLLIRRRQIKATKLSNSACNPIFKPIDTKEA